MKANNPYADQFEQTFTGMLNDQMVTRRGRLRQFWSEGVALVDATDAPGLWPRRFFVKAWDWSMLWRGIVDSWARNRPVPYAFKLFKPLAPDLTEKMLLIEGEQIPVLLDQMRSAGVLCNLKPISSQTLPKGILWAELPKLLLKQQY